MELHKFVVFTMQFTIRCPKCGKMYKREVPHCVHNTVFQIVCEGCGHEVGFQIKLENPPVRPAEKPQM